MIVLSPQSPAQHARDLAAMKRAAKRLMGSRSRAHAFLVQYGYITSDGKLTKRYS